MVSGEDGQKARRSQIEAFFAHGDVVGGTLNLDLLPMGIDERIVLRKPKKREQE